MKKYLNKLLVTTALGIVLLSSCQKQETQVYYEGGTAPVLSSNLKDTIPLVPADSMSSAVTFSWTNPNYIFSNGISSQNVTYNLQIDTLGANFTNPKLQTVSITPSFALSTSITVKDLNTYLASAQKLGLAASMPHKIQIRVVASLGANQGQLFSNVFNFIVTPYPPPPAVTPPGTEALNYKDGTLFIVGSATPGGWPPLTNDQSVEQFTQVSITEYKITIQLTGNGEYKLVQKVGSWGQQWSVAVQDDASEIYGGAFKFNGNNCIAPPTSGTYDIDVDFQVGKFTVTKH